MDRRRDPSPPNHGPPRNEGGQDGGPLAHQKLLNENNIISFEHFFHADCRNYDPSGGSGRLSFSAAEGAFPSRPQVYLCLEVLNPQSMPGSYTHIILGKFSRYYSLMSFFPSTDPIPHSQGDLQAGRSVLSINQATCCLTSF